MFLYGPSHMPTRTLHSDQFFLESALHFSSPDYENLLILCTVVQLSEFLIQGNEGLLSLLAVANDSA
jgi:hypothetical protein